jgi:hypothetical protein
MHNIGYHKFFAVVEALIPVLFFIMLGTMLFVAAETYTSGGDIFVFILLTL